MRDLHLRLQSNDLYTKEELKNVEFYTDFVDELRNKYLTEISSQVP